MLQRSRFLVLAVLAFAPVTALADIAPPQGYVETCTVERQQQQGEACRVCTGAYHGDRDFCAREFGSQGFEQRCRTRGASVWSEVWCASPEVAAAYVEGAGTTRVEVVLTTPGSGEGAAPAGTAAGEGSVAAPGEGSVPAVVPAEAAAAEVAAAAEAPAPEAAEPASATPESAPAETPGRRGCAAGSSALVGLIWLPLLAVRRRRNQTTAC